VPVSYVSEVDITDAPGLVTIKAPPGVKLSQEFYFEVLSGVTCGVLAIPNPGSVFAKKAAGRLLSVASVNGVDVASLDRDMLLDFLEGLVDAERTIVFVAQGAPATMVEKRFAVRTLGGGLLRAELPLGAEFKQTEFWFVGAAGSKIPWNKKSKLVAKKFDAPYVGLYVRALGDSPLHAALSYDVGFVKSFRGVAGGPDMTEEVMRELLTKSSGEAGRAISLIRVPSGDDAGKKGGLERFKGSPLQAELMMVGDELKVVGMENGCPLLAHLAEGAVITAVNGSADLVPKLCEADSPRFFDAVVDITARTNPIPQFKLAHVMFFPIVVPGIIRFGAETVTGMIGRVNGFVQTSGMEVLSVDITQLEGSAGTGTYNGAMARMDSSVYYAGGGDRSTKIIQVVRVWYNAYAAANRQPKVLNSISEQFRATKASEKDLANDCSIM